MEAQEDSMYVYFSDIKPVDEVVQFARIEECSSIRLPVSSLTLLILTMVGQDDLDKS